MADTKALEKELAAARKEKEKAESAADTAAAKIRKIRAQLEKLAKEPKDG